MIELTPFGTDSFAENPEPRVACLLLLDVSGSMAEIVGEAGHDLGYTVHSDGQTYRAVSGGVSKLDGLQEGLTAYKEAVAADELAAKRVETAILTFGEQVQTVCDFTTIESLQLPTLRAGGETPMGTAIRQGLDILRGRKELYKAHGISYFRPWMFLITDGGPTDEWRSAAEQVKQGEKDKAFSFFAVGVEDANYGVLKLIGTREPLKLKGMQFKEMFLWLSSSLSSVSRSNPGDTVPLVDPTAGPKGWASV